LKEDHIFSFEVDRKTIGNSAVNSVLVQFLSKLKGLITMPILTLLMAPGELGSFNLILVTSSILTPLVTLNLTDGTGIYFAQEKNVDSIRKMFNTVLNVIIILAIIFYLFEGLTYIIYDEYRPYLLWVGLILMANIVYKLPLFLLATYQNTGVILKNIFYRDVAVTIFTIILVYFGYSYKGMVIAAFFPQIIFSIFLYKIIYSYIDYSYIIDITILKKFLHISLPLLPVFFFSWIVQSSDSYFLAYFSGKETVGKYAVIYGITNVILSITFALNFFWFPVSARLWVENREQYRKVFNVVFAGLLSVLLAAVCLFELNSAAIMQILVRRDVYQDAHIIMGTIAFAFSMQVLITLLTAPLYSNRNIKAIFFSYLVGGILNTILNIVLIPKIGIIGAAASTALAYLVIVIVMGILNYRLAEFSFIDTRLKIIVPVFFACWGFLGWTRGHLSIMEVLLADIFFVTLVTISIYKKAMRSDEREYLASLFTNFRMKHRSEA